MAITTHLLHFDGSSGSTTFVDDGVDAVSVSAGGTGAIETTTTKFGTGALNTGTSTGWAYLAHSSDQEFGTGDFTIDAWAYENAGGGGGFAIFSKMLNAATVGAFHIKVDGGTTIFLLASSQTSSWDYILSAGGWTTGTFHHVALVRNGTSLVLYLDGVATISQTLPGGYVFWADPASLVTVGASSQSGGEVFNGFIDEFDMANFARWTTNFTPPTSPYLNVARLSAAILENSDRVAANAALLVPTLTGHITEQHDIVSAFATTTFTPLPPPPTPPPAPALVSVNQYIALIVPEHNSGLLLPPVIPILGHAAIHEQSDGPRGSIFASSPATASIREASDRVLAIAVANLPFGSLLHYDGSNGSTTFIDVNPAFTWTANTPGTPRLDTTRAMFGPSSFNPGGCGIITGQPSAPTWITGTSDFTWEAWGYLDSTSIGGASIFHLFSNNNNIGSQYEYLRVGNSTGPRVLTFASTYSLAPGTLTLVGSTVVTLDTWHHFAVVRNGTTVTIYLDGVADGVLTGITGSIGTGPTGTPTMTLGSDFVAVFPWIGNIDDSRATLIAKYTSNFTPAGPLSLP